MFPAEWLLGWLADYHLAATLLLLVAFAAWRWIRQPVHRILVAWTVMLELIVLAIVCALPFWPRVSLVAVTSQEVAVERPMGGYPHVLAGSPIPIDPIAEESPLHSVPFTRKTSEPVTSSVHVSPSWTWAELVAIGYLAGASMVSLWLCWGAVAAMWLCKWARPASGPLQAELAQAVQGRGQVPRLLVSPRVVNAVAMGILRPTIILPAALAESSPPQPLRAVLSHEWAHIHNRDLWLLAVGRCLLALLFAHPLIWWLRRAIRNDQELLADAIAAGHNRHAYAEELLRLIRKTAHPSTVAVSAAIGIWESPSQLSRRVAMLLDETFCVQPTGSRRWQCRALGLMAALGVAISLVTFQPARSAGGQAKTPDAVELKAAGQADRATGKPAEEAKGQNRGQRSKESSPGGGAKSRVVRTSIIEFSSRSSDSNDEPRDVIVIAGYPLLQEQAVLKELNVTAEQSTRLRAIQAKYYADQWKFLQEMRGLPVDKRTEALTRWDVDKKKETRKQVEEVLNPKQTETLKELTFARKAVSRVFDPGVLEDLGATAEQRVKLKAIVEQDGRRFQQDYQNRQDRAMAILSPQQRARLREESLGPEGLRAYAELTIKVEGEAQPLLVFTVYPYPDLSEETVRKQLGLNSSQQSQVRVLMGGSASQTEYFERKLQKLSPEERKKWQASRAGTSAYGFGGSTAGLSQEQRKKRLADFAEKMKKRQREERAKFEEQPMAKIGADLRRQFQAVLTPEQLAVYRDMAFRNISGSAIWDQQLVRKIGASDEQKAALRRMFDENHAAFDKSSRDAVGKALKILTPAQRERLRSELERQDW